MVQKPFLLNPAFEGTLESGAFRRRFIDMYIPKFSKYILIWPYAVPCVIVSLAAVISLDRAVILVACALVGGVSAFWGLVYLFFRFDRAKVAHLHRLALEGELVFGRLLSCERKHFGYSEGGTYEVEVQWEATTPSGKPLKGTITRERDDLLNAALPALGAPVAVLVLDETNYQLL